MLIDDGYYAPRELSSALTFVYKVLFPLLWIGVFAFATLMLFVDPDPSSPSRGDEKWLFLLATVVGSFFLYKLLMHLQVVTLRGDELLIGGPGREIVVPLRDVESVSGSIFLSPELVWIHLRQPAELGEKIVFMPKLRFFGGFTRHPVVAELNELVRRASF